MDIELTHETDDYTKRIEELLETVGNAELTELVQRLIQERNHLSQISNVDPLTGLNNRYILSNVKNVTGVLMIDVDDFKSINDTYGHDVGDYAIKAVAEIIKCSARSSDYVCRYGGDEFVLAFIDCPKDIVMQRAKMISSKVTDTLRLQERQITVSVGVAIKDNNEHMLDDLIKKADMAMYFSKKKGKNQVVDFDSIEKPNSLHR